METGNKKMAVFLSVLRVLETVYLLTFVFILYAYTNPTDEAIPALLNDWVIISYLLLPVLLFKNILVAILGNGNLKQWHKIYILIRCAIYVLLAFYSYGLISSL
jgi:hypothetical protein